MLRNRLIVVGMLILCIGVRTYAFDVSAFGDPVSAVRGVAHHPPHFLYKVHVEPGGSFRGLGNCAGDTNSMAYPDSNDVNVWLSNVHVANQNALRWWEEMGVTKLWVEYENADFGELDGHNIQVINNYFPAFGHRYTDAFRRDTRVADPSRPWHSSDRRGESIDTVFIPNVLDVGLSEWVYKIDTTASAGDTICAIKDPAGNIIKFGPWSGWYHRGAYDNDSITMPMHFKFRADIELTPGDTNTHVATFYWFVRDWCCDTVGDDNNWVRFPGIKIRTTDFDLNSPVFSEIEKVIVPHRAQMRDSVPNYYEDTTFVTYDAQLETRIDSGYGYVFGGSPQGGGVTEVAFLMTYSGNHTLFLHEVEAWDEGHHRLFRSPDSTAWRTYIGDQFAAQYHANENYHAGWYYDEYDARPNAVDEQLENLVEVNKILEDRGLPVIWMNGHPWSPGAMRERLWNKMEEKNTYFNMHLEEFYPYSNATWEVPISWGGGTVKYMFTDSSSDVPYVSYEEVGEISGDWTNCSGDYTAATYTGSKSLQAALDGEIWGYGDLSDAVGIETCPYSSQDVDEDFVTQIGWVHDRGANIWLAVQGGVDAENDQSNCCPIRNPTPNEVKLNAWLSVAVDADGIMYYWGMSGNREDSLASYLGGPLDWGSDSSNVEYGFDFCGPRSVHRTDRYYAAKEVCNEIHEIAPTLEALEFGGTTASSIFELSYPSLPDSLQIELDNWITCGENLVRTSVGDIFAMHWDESGCEWQRDDDSYIQLSYWKGMDSTTTDMWFLLVNRRGLAGETRKACIDLRNLEESVDYVAEYILGDSVAVTSTLPYGDNNFCDGGGDFGRRIQAIVGPGEAELIHFYLQDTTDLVFSDTTTLTAPRYYNRNIILNGAQVTIVPDTAAQRYQIMRNGQWEDQWKDSLEILFAPGKGIKMIEPDSGFNKLTILGNDSTQIIMKCSKGNEYKWAGIESNATRHKSSVTLRNTTIANATFGLKSTAGKSVDSLVACEFLNNGQVGVYSSGYRQVYITDCKFERNGTAIQAQSGTIVRGRNSEITKSKQYGILATRGCTLDLNEVSVRDGLGEKAGYGGIRSVHSDNWMKCCKIENNKGVGIEIYGGSLLMANVDTVNGDFGDNWVIGNSKEEIVLADGASFSFAMGHNSIYDPNTSDTTAFCRHCPVPWLVWENYQNAPLSPSLQGNYWNGVTDTSVLLTDFVKGLPFSFSPFLTEQLGCNELPHGDSPLDNCISEGVSEELQPDFSGANANYRDILESTISSNCNKPSAVNRLLAINYLSTSNDTVTQNYLVGIQDTSSDSETRHAAAMGIGLSLSENFLEMDSAKAIYQQIIDSSDGNVCRKIDGQVGKLLVEMREEEMDSIDGLTSDELTVFMDSLDQILGQRFVWTKYEITDTVVMYAPVRVDSVINIRGDGVLTILPHPGYRNPVVEFADKGAIKVWGTDTTKAKGKLYVYGQPGSRITLHWEDSTGTKNIYSERGFVKVKHARLYGNGFVNQSQDAQGYVNGLRRATFQADSCSFSWFDEGVMARATDTTSYMRACTLAYMGGSAQYSGFGAGLILLRADGFLVEDCVFDGNDGVGIYHALATDVVIRNSQIINGAKVGVFGASSGGGDCRIECSMIASNGDTLPELRTYGVTYDLVGGHNTFSDSSGSLIYATDPSFVDLEEGENSFELLGSGRYLQSGDTNDVWDVTWNTWYPLTPEDSGFYSNLWPTTTSKWTIDSSLTNFVSCDMPGASSMGGDSWLIVGDDPIAGTMSTESDDETAAFSLSAQSPNAKSPASKNALEASKGGTTKTDITKARQEAKAERIAAHHQELAAMRALKKLSAVDRRRLAMMLVNEGRVSEFEPAALGVIARGAVWHDPANTSSKFLLDYGSRGKDRSKRDFAKRLGYQALAQEGHPADAIAGLEELMQNAGSTRDSILALMDAMSIYYEHHNGQALQPLNSQIAVDDPYDLVRRTLFLSELLESGGAATKDANSAIPTSYALHQNYPNPFNPNTEIRFDLPEAIHAELKVFNILGQEVVTLVDDVRAAGAYLVLWDGKNATGLTVASGVYIYQIKTPNFTDAKKMMLIR